MGKSLPPYWASSQPLLCELGSGGFCRCVCVCGWMLLEEGVGVGFPTEATSHAVYMAKNSFPTFGLQ